MTDHYNQRPQHDRREEGKSVVRVHAGNAEEADC